MASEDEEKERRLHLWLCEQTLEPLHRVSQSMFKIEVERARRYGRTDSMAMKAYEAREETDKTKKKIDEILDMLLKEKNRHKG